MSFPLKDLPGISKRDVNINRKSFQVLNNNSSTWLFIFFVFVFVRLFPCGS